MKKYELTGNFIIDFLGHKLFQIKALISFGSVKEGELGGWIEGEKNLDHNGNAWVYGNARVSGNARVYGDAQVYGDARVSGNARVYGDAWVSSNARVSGNARVYGDADYTIIKGFGSEYRNTTFFRGKDDEILVNCGCFNGSIDEFRAKVKETHGDSKLAVEYLAIADLMENHFNKED